uniref:Uncharacterized protein n=1 Tax=Arundo donax TaxID=35708 RepID=A0A0A9CWB3_ARUDO
MLTWVPCKPLVMQSKEGCTGLRNPKWNDVYINWKMFICFRQCLNPSSYIHLSISTNSNKGLGYSEGIENHNFVNLLA